ncbi:MAG: helix-turn-helix transcriptional regulator [Clostridia bacterium]|nr:helix-turn-helix transcriptional regulator [Clostridia bacterium]
MSNNRSFKTYVFNRFYNDFHEAINIFISQNRDSLDIESWHVDQIDETYLDDINIKHIYINDLPGMKVAFDVLIEAIFEIHEIDRRHDKYDEVSNWFKISCIADLETGLGDFSIEYVEIYSHKEKQLKPLSDTLVPIIKKEELEKVAVDFLKIYYPEALKEPTYINPDDLAERMGLSVELRHITPDFSTFGQIFFVDTKTSYYDKELSGYKAINVTAGTVFVDPDAFFLRNLGSVNNTIVHECVHWHLHRKAFQLERLYNKNATQIQCQVVGGVKDSAIQSSTDFMEWHANALAPRIQMPFYQTKIKAAEFIRKYLKQNPEAKVIDIMENVIDEVSYFFMVSRLAAKIRMIDIGYEEAIGTFTYIDGKYVKPHTFKKGSIKKNQTFSISEVDAIIQSSINPSLKKKLESGNYIFVDSHFCINHPKYVQYDMWGQASLTDYARYNMHECCLVFDIVFNKPVGKFNEDFYYKCILFKDATSDIIFEARFSDSSINDNIDAQAQAIMAYSKDIANVLQSMPGNFPGALVYLMNWRDITVEGLAEKTFLDPRTIQRLRNDQTNKTTIETIIAVCIALQLPPPISNRLIDLSTCSLGVGEEHMAYHCLLTSYYTRPIIDCNSLLTNMNLKPLTKEK